MASNADFTLLDMAYPYQRKFIQAKQKRKIWLSARQIGKSWTMAFIAVYKALMKKNGLSLCVSTGARAAGELMKKVQQMAEAVKTLSNGAITFESSADCVRFSNGSRVLSLPSGNPAALRGYSAACTVIDEAAYIDNAEQVMQAILPTLTRDKSAELVVASTPAGCSGLFWDLWSSEDEGWYKQETTIEDAVADGLEIDLEAVRKLCSDEEVFQIEYMCKFSKSVGTYIDPSALEFADRCPFSGGRNVLGVDFGRKNDSTAMSELVEVQDKIWVDNITVLTNAEWQSQFTAIEALDKKKHFSTGHMDANGIGSAIAEQVQKRVNQRLEPFQTTGSNKTPMYEFFKGLVYDKKIVFNSAFRDLIVRDLANVKKIVADNGKVSYSAGHASGHSDVTSSLVLGVWATKLHPLTFSKPIAYMHRSVF